jgi:tryptophan synthase alpha chain
MSRIEEKFNKLEKDNEKALVMYLTAGDPDLDTTGKLLFALEEAGADIIEIGVPFSDPMADGPTIQKAAGRAIERGATLDNILNILEEVRPKLNIPVILFGYFNPIFNYGLKKFSKRAEEVGIDGLILVDLPYEESREIRRFTDNLDDGRRIDFINLISPVTDSERMKKIVSDASGFLYYVSVTGVTGARDELPTDVEEQIVRLKEITDLPVVVGFGVSNPETAARLGGVSDGVVVGSALVNIIEEFGSDTETLFGKVVDFVSSLKEGLKSG